jgi:cytochrome c-type biogenesis protein CcmH
MALQWQRVCMIGQLMLILASLVLATVASESALAQVDAFEFESPEQQRRFRKFSDELRCPMCQNTSLSGSTGGTAEDLRRELYRMIIDGWSDAEIERFMYERYGDFIFYRPRFRSDTAILWLAPLVFLLIAGVAGYGILRGAQRRSPTGRSDQLDPEQQRRLDALLDDR